MYAAPPYPHHPPPGYGHYDSYLRTPPVSPSPNMHGYYSPRYSQHTATPSPRPSPQPKGHTRRASHHDPPQYQSSYAQPQPQYYGRYASPQYQPSQHTTPRREPDYVSTERLYRSRGRRYTGTEHYDRSYPDRKHPHSSSRYYTKVVIDDDYPYERSPPPPYEEYYQSYRFGGADQFCYDQVPIYTDADSTPHRSRARRNSHTNTSSRRPASPPPKPKPAHAKSPPQATEEDARRANIPAGYSYKNWDPAEEPILLLGSVFDANSLGKWIYDWTVFVHTRASPMAQVAGEMWLLLIQLAGKIKRAEDTMPKIRRQESRDMVEEFLESGERLWARFGKLLKMCEDYMWKAAKDSTGQKKPTQMGMNSGVEFVDSMFGRDRELEKTEKLMHAMRLWSMRFEANCEDILRHPSA